MTHSTIISGKPLPEKADLADFLASGWTGEQVIAWAKERVTPWPPDADPPESPQISPQDTEVPPVDAYDDESTEDTPPASPPLTEHFKPLGTQKNNYFYLPHGTRQIVSLSPLQHVPKNLQHLAPIAWWAGQYSGKGNGGVDWDAATDSLFRHGQRIGYFNPNMIRGRGAWVDEGRQILHLGTKVYVDGVPHEPRDVDSRYVYQGDLDLNIDPGAAAETKEAHQLVNICNQLAWEKPISGALLAGWCVIAPVCGILKWRPHVWITGAAGTGKTTIVEMIVKQVVGHMALAVEGDTTEAGVRQQLGLDALPVIFDEAESKNKAAIQRMAGILGLARLASSGGKLHKGTTDGKGMQFNIRSCFCFSAINPGVDHYADEARITRLILRKDESPDAAEKWIALRDKMLTVLTPTFANRMLARSLANLRTLQHNCDTFVEAAARVFKSRRLADQIGNLLAGAYLCHNLKEITETDAVVWIEKQDWAEIMETTAKTDEERLIDRIATHRVRLTTEKGIKDSTLGELIVIVADGDITGSISPKEAATELGRTGIIAETSHFLIANQSNPLKDILQGTPWASDWKRPLKDLHDAESIGTTYFGPGIRSRATKLPLKIITA